MSKRPDVEIGPIRISPSLRRIEGPAGNAAIEPIVLQVLLMLVDARGSVVTRDELFDAIWPSGTAGDDSLNRAVASARRMSEKVAPGTLSIETIPRTGYRMTLADDAAAPVKGAVEGPGKGVRKLDRRTAVAGFAAVAGAGAIGAFWLQNVRDDRRYQALIERGMRQLNYGAGPDQAKAMFEQALALRPDEPDALGLYSYALAVQPARAGNGPTASQRARTGTGAAGAALDDATRAARKALAQDSGQPFARLTMVLASEGRLDMAREEGVLRAILADAPRNIHVMRHLWNLLQCAGRSRETYRLIERALAIEPFAALVHFPRGQLLWILGRNAEAERVLDLALRYWPEHPFVRFARFIFLAFTARARAAQAMLESPGTAPQNFSEAAVTLWKQSLPALETRAPADVANAIRLNREAALAQPKLTNQAVMTLSKLGQVDASFDLLDAFFAVQPGGRAAASTAWRFAPWLFTPPLALVRADPRFLGLCEAIGLADYWEKRGVRPDHPIAGL